MKYNNAMCIVLSNKRGIDNIHLPSSSVVVFTTELVALGPTLLVANTLMLYVVQGRRPSREAFVEELDTTQVLLDNP